MAATRRMTVAQATLEFLRNQLSERDGERRRLVPAMCGIFGHGNVPGMGQGLDEAGNDLPFYQVKNEQARARGGREPAAAMEAFSNPP